MKTCSADALPEPDGWIIEMFEGSCWLTSDLRVTEEWEERGIWPTHEEAGKAMLASWE